MSANCSRCTDTGMVDDLPSGIRYFCSCEEGAKWRRSSNRSAVDAYRRASMEPITSASHAAQWDEMESALDTVRLQHRHVCRGCDLTLPLGVKCGAYCKRCEPEAEALSKPAPKPAPKLDKLDRWVIGGLLGLCVFVVLLLIKTMVWG